MTTIDVERIDIMATYYQELGNIEDANRSELIRFAVNALWELTKLNVDKRRHGGRG